jgi:hypothetical protein
MHIISNIALREVLILAMNPQVFSMLPGNVTRMVVGHTPQPDGANEVCRGGVWRIDVGMSRGVLKGTPQALEIRPGQNVRVLTEGALDWEWRDDGDSGGRQIGLQRGGDDGSLWDKIVSVVSGRWRNSLVRAGTCAADVWVLRVPFLSRNQMWRYSSWVLWNCFCTCSSQVV